VDIAVTYAGDNRDQARYFVLRKYGEELFFESRVARGGVIVVSEDDAYCRQAFSIRRRACSFMEAKSDQDKSIQQDGQDGHRGLLIDTGAASVRASDGSGPLARANP